MLLLILGLILWAGAHYYKRLAPDSRAALGTPGKGIIAVVIVLSLVLMIVGYRGAAFIPVWQPPAFMVHINNLLMILAFWIYGSSAAKGAKAWPAYKTRHPQLLAVKTWAIAHLLVNGDLASILLFGGLLAWAVGSVIMINRAEPAWTPPAHAGRPTYIRLAVITLVIVAIVTAIHSWLGVWPFPS
ncbi:NnrU protein [Sulfitobacter noctilucicola]|uniref:Putative membrane protein n=1 Tax=Sulfitobacter noctilucicola TaxID=1342301 RepID=A0A7W6M9A0_9RHOB|nr:NnrU family protein [Sulfitobacter noctilucicola]KIN63677.1 NnrU protein [Sulfitobacter noctilucicola]MBB4174814.1 putative membrane protein [Sulfitobacter noctilucicola]